MPDILISRGSERVALDEVNGPWVWLIVSDYGFAGDPTSDELLAALVEHAGFVTDTFVSGAAHGPYLLSAVGASQFERGDAAAVERQFADWIAHEGPSVPLDPEPILAREIRPRLVGDEFFCVERTQRR
jgi:hypothetical protein